MPTVTRAAPLVFFWNSSATASVIGSIAALGRPVLVGVSRKGLVGALTGREVEDRLAGSIGAALAVILIVCSLLLLYAAARVGAKQSAL